MSKFKGNLKLGLMVILSIVGSILPFVLVAPVIRVAYSNYSRRAFWISYSLGFLSLILIKQIPIAISLMSITLMIGVFSEVYSRNQRMFIASFTALIVSATTTIVATQQWLVANGTTLAIRLNEQVQLVIKQAQQMNPQMSALSKLDPNYLVGQAPSVLAGLLLMSLALALILEHAVSRLLKFSEENRVAMNLLGFRLPDEFIWIAMISFLLSFLDIGNKTITMVSTNIVNVMVVLYFFQGIAVVEAFFTVLRLGFFVRFITYVVFLVQLFFLVAAIGVIDFWVEFRKRFIRIRLNP